MKQANPIVDIIGEEEFLWLSRTFGRSTALEEIPDRILERLASVDITLRDYRGDSHAVTAIALITFAYQLAGRRQSAQSGPKDILLVKVLARRELLRRKGGPVSGNPLWKAPLLDLLLGEAGERLRAMPMLHSP